MRRIVILSLLPFLLAIAAAHAQSSGRWELGPRLLVLNAGGEPANDLMGAGVFGRYRLNDRWLVGFAVDSITGDYERPYEFVGISSPEEVDSTIDAVIWSGWIEREYGRQDGRLRWFWTAGLGFTSPDTEDITGPAPGGGTFDITTDAGSEILASIGFGLRHGLGRRWGLEYGVQAAQHFADWKITDRVSGRTGSIDDYTVYRLHLGLTYRF
ncbi:MAG TPA: outer membrane beta-barrel protein [Thermoanaerobaculia bacterium]|nr:outer membrane beta-barrel protein [Thermoanaerobaculia bacterium]